MDKELDNVIPIFHFLPSIFLSTALRRRNYDIYATVQKIMPDYAKFSKIMKIMKIMPSGTPATYVL